MNAANDSESETMANDSIWLELSIDGKAQAFELFADETRAVAVGSLLRADLRIDRPGVAPVQFHVEREGKDLWIVPAYSSEELRVDTARINGPRRIEGRAVIEFCGVRIHARVLEQNPGTTRESSARLRSDDWSGRPLESPSRVFEQRELGIMEGAASLPPLSDGALPTITLEQFVTPPIPSNEQPTTRFAPLATSVVLPVQRTVAIEPFRVIPLTSEPEAERVPPTLRTGEIPAQPVEATERIEPVNNPLAQDTIQMAPFWMTEPVPEQNERTSVPPADQSVRTNSELAPVSLVPGESFVPQERRPSQAQADTAVTTYFEPFRISKAPFATGLDVGTQSTTVFDVPYVQAEEPESRAWLARLGLLSTRRPVLVWVVGTVGAFALSASIALLSRHHQEPSKSQAHHASPATSVASSSANSAAVTSPNVPTSSRSVPKPIIVIPAVPPLATSSPKKGQPSNPELVAAVGHLISGRYSDAQAAYTALAARSPDDPSLAVVSRLLAKKADSKCSSSAPRANIACPEVKP